jgi:outer membrane protein OmpA-like peptidoglycan-associated protein
LEKFWDLPVLSGFVILLVTLAIVLLWLFSDVEPPPVTSSAPPVATPPAAAPAPVSNPAPPVADSIPPPSPPPAVAAVNDPRAASADWVRLTRDAVELPVRIHFSTGATTLSAQALSDLKRLADYVKRQYPDSRLRVLGFSDAGGSEPGNVRLSRQRAESVAQVLQRQGLAVEEVAGLGSQAPLVPNDTPANRDRNRRVEVWVRVE